MDTYKGMLRGWSMGRGSLAQRRISLIEWITKSSDKHSSKNDFIELTSTDHKTICNARKGNYTIIFLQINND
jgi:hypothetical protein